MRMVVVVVEVFGEMDKQLRGSMKLRPAFSVQLKKTPLQAGPGRQKARNAPCL